MLIVVSSSGFNLGKQHTATAATTTSSLIESLCTVVLSPHAVCSPPNNQCKHCKSPLLCFGFLRLMSFLISWPRGHTQRGQAINRGERLNHGQTGERRRKEGNDHNVVVVRLHTHDNFECFVGKFLCFRRSHACKKVRGNF